MDVSIIIVNYNTKNLLKQCLKSVYQYTIDICFEIIVVDNASVDESQPMIKNDFPNVILIESKENLGFGKANNLAIDNATGKYIFLLNSDTILLNNVVLLFYNYMEANNSSESIGAIGALLLDADEKPVFSFGEFPTIRSELLYIKRKIIDRIRKDPSYYFPDFRNNLFINVEFITGADLFIPKKIIEKIGAFDPQFFLYYEETDLQKRMADNGFQRLIISGPKITHLEGGSFSSPSEFSYSRFLPSQESFHLYIKKHFTGIKYVVFRLFMILIRSLIVFDRRFNFNEKVKALKLIISGRI